MKVFTRGLLAWIVGVGLLMGVVGCDSQEEDPAQLRVVHAAPNAGAVDFFIDFELFTRSLAFRSASPYQRWDPGLRNLEVRSTGGQDPSVTRDVVVDGEEAYTFLITGTLTPEALFVLEDDRTTPPAGVSRLRMVHAATAVATFGFTAVQEEGGANFSATVNGLGSTTPFFAAPVGSYTIEMLPPLGPPITLNATLESGVRYLVVVTNSLAFIVTDG